ncbi:N-acetyltransferase [Marinomonas hwangdonensis]|uniref:N-acetyltransferase n=1 Tax=Marinomonas hwangdonensis TaxID=1053647 RepID=A0A3M8Q9Q1_9GAMM|nr:N-acetyltransferase [Marinomonas hwangdonensis]
MVRRAELDDAPSILAIFCGEQAHSGKSRYKDVNLIDVIDWIERMTDRHPLFVMAQQGEIIAWCSIEPFYGLAAFDETCEVSLYVKPAYQQNGVGTQLLGYLMDQHLALCFTRLIAYVFESNLSSRVFFEKQGFEQWGKLPGVARHEFGQEDVYLYGKLLS